MQTRLFTFNRVDTFVHRLSGFTKLLCFLILTSAVMYTYDIRVILGILVFSFTILRISRIRYRDIKLMLIYVFVFLAVNFVLTFFFSPEEGVKIYGTRHVILYLLGRYNVTSEQLLYQTTKFMKYFSVIPLGMVFLFTTNPSEFASSLNRAHVNYKVAYAVSLTLRYFPDVARAFTNISLSQQARGVDLSYKAKLSERFKNASLLLIPLIFSSLERIESVSNAMDLRGFGKYKTRTWYTSKEMDKEDYIAIAVSLLILLLTIFVSVYIDKGRFYNPFIK